MLTVLFLGDIVGAPGRNAVVARLPELKEKHALDFIIVNGENAAGGRGITGKITIELLRAGASVVTTGDHIWDQKEIIQFLDLEPRLLRPLNYPDGAPGNGSIVLETAKGKIGVINVQGRTFMQPILENPFRAVEAAVTKMRQETANIIVDAHRWKSLRCNRHTHSCSDSGRTNLPRWHRIFVRRGNVRPDKFDSRARHRTDHEPVYFQSSGVVSCRYRRSAATGGIDRDRRNDRSRVAHHAVG